MKLKAAYNSDGVWKVVENRCKSDVRYWFWDYKVSDSKSYREAVMKIKQHYKVKRSYNLGELQNGYNCPKLSRPENGGKKAFEIE